MNARADTIQAITQEVASWAGIQVQPHRLGGVEFNLGAREIGHVHPYGALDILFTQRIRDELLREQRVELHHFLPQSGWTSYYVHDAQQLPPALWLLRLSYLFQLQRRPEALPLAPRGADLAEALQLSPRLRELVGVGASPPPEAAAPPAA